MLFFFGLAAWQVALHLSLLIRLDFIPGIFGTGVRPAVIFRNSCFAVATFLRSSLQQRRAQALTRARRLKLREVGFNPGLLSPPHPLRAPESSIGLRTLGVVPK